jgi:DNA-binding protein
LNVASNVVFIGRNPPMSYVLAVLTGFSSSKAEDIILKARGRAITTAVDVAEITRRRFMKELSVSTIIIGTEELPRDGGGTRAVSTIEITLNKSLPEGKAEQKLDEEKVEEQPVSE